MEVMENVSIYMIKDLIENRGFRVQKQSSNGNTLFFELISPTSLYSFKTEDKEIIDYLDSIRKIK